MPAGASWYYLDYRRRVGPFDGAAMRHLLKDGTLSPLTMVRSADAQRWRPLRETELWDERLSRLSRPAPSRKSRGLRVVPPRPAQAAKPSPAAAGRSRGRAGSGALLRLSVLAASLAASAGLIAAGETMPAAFLFAISTWIVSVCLHEFAHAGVAFVGGDSSVHGRGYLSLDPARYVDPVLSLALPLVALLFGGLPFPGGSVLIEEGRLRSRAWRCATALAGPATNLLLFLLCARLTLLLDRPMAQVVAFTAFLQFSAFALNLLPLPGLDGFAALRPFLPAALRTQADRFAGISVWVLMAVLLAAPSIAGAAAQHILHACATAGIAPSDVARGRDLVMFWRGWGGNLAVLGPAGLLTAGLAAAKLAEMSRAGVLDAASRRQALVGGIGLAAAMIAGALILDRP